MRSPKLPKMADPPPPPLPPPPVSTSGADKAAADLEARRRQGKRYNFEDTIIGSSGLKSTFG